MFSKLLTIAALLFTLAASAQTKTPIDSAAKYTGQTVTICDRVYSGRFLESSGSKPTLLNLGGEYPNHKLTVLINLADRKNFKDAPETFYAGKNVCVTGKVIDYKGKPEIIVSGPDAIKIEETKQGLEKGEREK